MTTTELGCPVPDLTQPTAAVRGSPALLCWEREHGTLHEGNEAERSWWYHSTAVLSLVWGCSSCQHHPDPSQQHAATEPERESQAGSWSGRPQQRCLDFRVSFLKSPVFVLCTLKSRHVKNLLVLTTRHLTSRNTGLLVLCLVPLQHTHYSKSACAAPRRHPLNAPVHRPDQQGCHTTCRNSLKHS